jgi:hypothetical protein
MQKSSNFESRDMIYKYLYTPNRTRGEKERMQKEVVLYKSDVQDAIITV